MPTNDPRNTPPVTSAPLPPSQYGGAVGGIARGAATFLGGYLRKRGLDDEQGAEDLRQAADDIATRLQYRWWQNEHENWTKSAGQAHSAKMMQIKQGIFEAEKLANDKIKDPKERAQHIQEVYAQGVLQMQQADQELFDSTQSYITNPLVGQTANSLLQKRIQSFNELIGGREAVAQMQQQQTQAQMAEPMAQAKIDQAKVGMDATRVGMDLTKQNIEESKTRQQLTQAQLAQLKEPKKSPIQQIVDRLPTQFKGSQFEEMTAGTKAAAIRWTATNLPEQVEVEFGREVTKEGSRLAGVVREYVSALREKDPKARRALKEEFERLLPGESIDNFIKEEFGEEEINAGVERATELMQRERAGEFRERAAANVFKQIKDEELGYPIQEPAPPRLRDPSPQPAAPQQVPYQERIDDLKERIKVISGPLKEKAQTQLKEVQREAEVAKNAAKLDEERAIQDEEEMRSGTNLVPEAQVKLETKYGEEIDKSIKSLNAPKWDTSNLISDAKDFGLLYKEMLPEYAEKALSPSFVVPLRAAIEQTSIPSVVKEKKTPERDEKLNLLFSAFVRDWNTKNPSQPITLVDAIKEFAFAEKPSLLRKAINAADNSKVEQAEKEFDTEAKKIKFLRNWYGEGKARKLLRDYREEKGKK